MLHVVTTISQHPRGFDFHLQNLRWALSGCEHRIHVQTFEAWELEAEGVHFIEVDHDPNEWYPFWRLSSPHLAEMAEDATAFLFVELDNLFTEPIAPLVRECVEKQEIAMLLESPFLSLYDEARTRIYPRIWEGGIIIPAAVVRGAIREGVNMGRHLDAFKAGSPIFERYRDQLAPLWSTDAPHNRLGFQPLMPYFEKAAQEPVKIDTMFDFGLYCYCTGVPCPGHGDMETGYDMGPSVIHLRGVEVACRCLPDIYDSVGSLQRLPDWFIQRHLNSIALMLLLAEIYPRDDAVAKILTLDEGLSLQREFIERIRRHAADWLSPSQIEGLDWAREVVWQASEEAEAPLLRVAAG